MRQSVHNQQQANKQTVKYSLKRGGMFTLALLLFFLAIGRLSTRSVEAQGKTDLVMAFYYAWFDPSSFGSDKTPYQPIHPYFSTGSDTIRRQINMAKAAGIDGFVQSWYGPNPNQQTEPNFAKLLQFAGQSHFKAAVHFEVASPFFSGNQDRINALKTLFNTHAQHPAYLKLDGKPVIFFWATWALPVSEWRYIREQADPYNQAIWIAEGGHTEYLSVFDGLHLYNVAWSANPAGVNHRWAVETRYAAETYGEYKYWAATSMPGFDNSLVPGATVTVRNRNDGDYLKSSFRGAANTNPDILLLTSFNEWPEASGIEPSHEFGNFYLNLTRQLVASYKGRSESSFPPIPAWIPPVPTATPVLQAGTKRGPELDTPAIGGSKTVHTIASGDTLIGVAVRYDVTLDSLYALNNLSAGSILSVGQEILVIDSAETPPSPQTTADPTIAATPTSSIPTSTPAVVAVAQAVAVAQTDATPELVPRAVDSGTDIHTVATGDTLSSIAFTYNITLDEVLAWNGITRDDFLTLGQTLIVAPPDGTISPTAVPEAAVVEAAPQPAQEVSAEFPEPKADGSVTYTVIPGDSFAGISDRFGVSVADIYRLNNMSDQTLLVIGQALILRGPDDVQPVGSNNAPPRFADAVLRDTRFVHLVQTGDTLTAIAVQYGYDTMADFYAASGLNKESLLTIGQEVTVGLKPQPAEVGGSTDAPTVEPTPIPPPPTATVPPTEPAQPVEAATPVPTVTLAPPPPLPTALSEPAIALEQEEVAVVVDVAPTIRPTTEPLLTPVPVNRDLILPALFTLIGAFAVLIVVLWYLIVRQK